jgi:tRNA nucleotidyltransferase (CCA-adding enzyme)
VSMEKALNIAKTLHAKGFESYFVGGFVRDFLLGITNSDVDLVTSANPDEIIKIFENNKVDLVGKSFGVVIVDGVEVATYRKDRYFGMSDKNCYILPGDIFDDASRRDFTFNALYFDPITGETLDFFDGKEDLRKRIVRFVGEPSERIFEDPNRIIRACRFLSALDGTFSKETLEELKNRADYVHTLVAPERIRLEILKAMKTKKASKFFRALHEIGALRYVFPSLEECYGVDGGQHHREDVFEHSMMVGDALDIKNPLLKLAGYIHDVGKTSSVGINADTGEVWFKDHEDKGTELVEQELSALKFFNEEVQYISSLVKFHMRMSKDMGPKAVRKFLRELNEVKLSWEDLIRLRLADRQGNLKSINKDSSLARTLVAKFWAETRRKNLPLTVKDLVVNGNDVMEVLGIPPGPKVGEVLNFLLNFVLEYPDRNERDFLQYEMKVYFKGNNL